MANRTWLIGGSLVGVAAFTLVAVLVWRTAEMVGLVAGGSVDMGVHLAPPAEPDEPPEVPSAIDGVTSGAGRERGLVRGSRVGGFAPDNLKLEPERLAIRHEARTAWRQNLSEEELERVRERVREKQDGMSPEQRAARRDRKDARREARGQLAEPDFVELDAEPLDGEVEPEPEPEPE